MFVQKPNNSKITEKLKILNQRIKNVLIQIDYLKNILLSEGNSFHSICNDSNYEQGIKFLLKKYPIIEIKNNKSNLEHLIAIQPRLLNDLYFHYFTLVDVLEIKDSLMDLFGQISAFQFPLDIHSNFDMTRLYLDIIANYCSIMIILCSIPQIKIILILYNFALQSKFDQDERYYHRLCERLVEKHKDGSISTLYNELNPYSKTIISAINSLEPILRSKQTPIIDWKQKKMFQLSLSTENDQLKKMDPVYLVPYDQIERWILFGYLSIYPEIIKSLSATQLWRNVLSFSASIVLFRSEMLQIHPFLLKFFETQKGCAKLVTIVKETAKELSNQGVGLHRSRCNYLRMEMRHQIQAIIDAPGFMAPNVYRLCSTLCTATDELQWMVKHVDLPPNVGKRLVMFKLDELVDPQLPEFLYQIEEIRHLLKQFNIINRYYCSVLKDMDLPEFVKSIDRLVDLLEEDDLGMLMSIKDKIQTIATLGNDDENTDLCDLDGQNVNDKSLKPVRLDWIRLQAQLSYIGSKFPWKDQFQWVRFINSMILRTHFLDNFPKFLDKFSSMKFLQFHRSKLSEWFDPNMKPVGQHRYLMVFPRICTHFLGNSNPNDCPEDYNVTLKSSMDLAHVFLLKICQELTCKVLNSMVKTHFDLNQKLQPCQAVDWYQFYNTSRKHKQMPASSVKIVKGSNTKQAGGAAPGLLPGQESKRSNMTDTTSFDKELMALNQLSVAINSRPVVINNRVLSPVLYLRKELIRFFNEKFVLLSEIKIKRDKGDTIVGARRPSEMLLLIEECMSLVTRISEFVNINVSQLFADIFLRQSLNKENMGFTTLTEVYCNWYTDFVLVQPHILHTPLLKCFLTIYPQNPKEAASIYINAEEYTDVEELRALVQVIGPYGMIELNEKLTKMILKSVSALRRFVLRNRSTLTELNVPNLEYGKVRKLISFLEDVDEFCHEWKQMGFLFAFKNLCRDAIGEIARKSMPFLKSTVEDLQHDFDTDISDQMSSVSERDDPVYNHFRNQLTINEICSVFGLKTQFDSTLFYAMESVKQQQQQIQVDPSGNIDQTEYAINELIIVATSYLLPRIVGSNFYHVEFEALDHSAHCAAYAIKELMYVFFFKYGEKRNELVHNFVAFSSTNLLRLGMETGAGVQINKDEAVLINNRDSIYIFFDFLIQILGNVSDDFYEECFPYALIRQAYHNVVKQSRLVMSKAAHPTELSSKAALEACNNINSK